MGLSNKLTDDSSTEINVNCEVQAQEISEGNNNSNWVRNNSFVVLAKNVVAFCLCPKNLPDSKLMHSGLIFFTKEIFKKPNI